MLTPTPEAKTVLLNPLRRSASWATAHTCPGTGFQPKRWPESGWAARAGCQSRKRPCPDSTRMCHHVIEAARNAMARAGIDPQELRAVWVGSESHPTL